MNPLDNSRLCRQLVDVDRTTRAAIAGIGPGPNTRWLMERGDAIHTAYLAMLAEREGEEV